jgi:hypothetical protein
MGRIFQMYNFSLPGDFAQNTKLSKYFRPMASAQGFLKEDFARPTITGGFLWNGIIFISPVLNVLNTRGIGFRLREKEQN